MKPETDLKKVLGLVMKDTHGFFVVGIVGLSDESGTPIEGVGLLITSVVPWVPAQGDEDDPIYDVPVFLNLENAGAVYLNIQEGPKEIKTLRKFSWEDVLDNDEDLS